MFAAPASWYIRTAESAEWKEALELLLAADLPPNHLPMAIESVTNHLRTGTLDPTAFFIATDAVRILGAVLGQQLPGAQALLFDVPQTLTDHSQAEQIKDALLITLLAWLKERGVKLVQCLLALTETLRATPLLRCGFHYVTELHYLRHFLEDIPLLKEPSLEFLQYQRSMRDRLADLITATYVDTLDCPELDGVRSISEVIEGHHQHAGNETPNWWFVRQNECDVGVLLTQDVVAETAWDLVYMGVIPSARRQGIGRQILEFALQQAKESQVRSVQLSVDVRNNPAVRLYQRLGFIPWEEKALFLMVLE